MRREGEEEKRLNSPSVNKKKREKAGV